MGLAEQLEYSVPDRNAFHRAVAATLSTRPGAFLTYHTAPRADRLVRRLSGGRSSVSGWFAGVPPIWLATLGAKSGLPRETPLFGIPIDDHVGVIGTGVGQSPTPAWVHNLEARPEAKVTFRERSAVAVARPAVADEAGRMWETAGQIYAGFPRYRRRVAHRDVRVFVLEPA